MARTILRGRNSGTKINGITKEVTISIQVTKELAQHCLCDSKPWITGTDIIDTNRAGHKLALILVHADRKANTLARRIVIQVVIHTRLMVAQGRTPSGRAGFHQITVRQVGHSCLLGNFQSEPLVVTSIVADLDLVFSGGNDASSKQEQGRKLHCDVV